MIPLILHRKTGFINLNPLKPIIIRDFRGKLFYSTEGLKPVKKFNLPEGNYFIEKGHFSELKRPIKYKLSKLPPAKRKFKKPFSFKIVFDHNPNKCTISWATDTIIFDNSMRDETLPVLYFILFHEYGHSVYGNEKAADLMSANLMKIKGFNPSQIGAAPITSLSHRQLSRKKHLVKKIIKSNGTKRFQYI